MKRSKFLIIIAFIAAILILDFLVLYFKGDITGGSIGNPSLPPASKDSVLSVSELMKKALINSSVNVKGTVNRILDDYKSKKGYSYQQFYITDGSEEIKIFCSQRYGNIDVKQGEAVLIKGKFQKYYNELEIYGYCSDVKIL
jgi:predicted extracellular nuclease